MEKFIIIGGQPLKGEITVGGAKNVAMKVILAGLLTDEKIIIHNVPLISSVLGTARIVEPLGVKVKRLDHTLEIYRDKSSDYKVPLELGGLYRTATMVIGPLLTTHGKAIVPNPGGCRLGKRPVNWHIEALKTMGAKIIYKNGYFYAEGKLHGAEINFLKNTHTGTESVILAAVLADGDTVINNAAAEPEVDDLIKLLNLMGAKIYRQGRIIKITGVKKLHGTTFRIMPDRNEVVTYAVAAISTRGDVTVHGTQREYLKAFLDVLDQTNAGWEPISEDTTRFFYKGELKNSQITTGYYPGFMTDWQAPWAVLASQTEGVSVIHETVYESRFAYVSELRKMGAKIEFFEPVVTDPDTFYNFNWTDRIPEYFQAIKIHGVTKLHEGVVEVTDLRAGATLVVAALVARGKSVIIGVEQIDRGYENFDKQLQSLGANITRIKEEV